MSHDAGFDARAHELHARSLEQLSPRVQAQLAQRRRAAMQGTAARASRGVLPSAGMATAGLALALVVQLGPPASTPRTDRPVAATSTTGSAARGDAASRPRVAIDPRVARVDPDAIAPDLAQDPEFYLWLGDVRPSNVE